MYRINVFSLRNKEEFSYFKKYERGTLELSMSNPVLFRTKVEAEHQIMKFLLDHPKPEKYFEVEKVEDYEDSSNTNV